MQKLVRLTSGETISKIFGSYDVNVRIMEKRLGVDITNRSDEEGDAVLIDGDANSVNAAEKAVKYLSKIADYNDDISDSQVSYVLDMIEDGRDGELISPGDDCICITTRGKPIKAKTVGQKQYVDAIKKNTVVLGIGPAGTGKTFLAVAMAVKALRDKQVNRIILTRPAVEAGEKLGFLPGDLQNKIDPYLRPLYDALYEMMGAENYQRHLEKNTIEVAPLAYMRGRTLDDSFIILDEAQNATPEQMKMFLTRLGFGSKAVVTGDLTQTDLPFGKKSGLAEAVKILDGIEDIAIHRFTDRDVVRHRLVQKIILAYDKYEKKLMEKNAEKANDKGHSFRVRKG
ncbi:MAG: PhoH family protein [Ruminococcaceae bacterium]|nr:PhoH family protein [Oscillospiraceae bacterium]